MKKGWKKAFSSQFHYEVSVIANLLKEHEIPTVTMDKQDMMYSSIGEIQLLVPDEHYEEAAKVIQKTAK